MARRPKAIQELMRHADLSMTQRYTHLSPAARESAVRLLDQRNCAHTDESATTLF